VSPSLSFLRDVAPEDSVVAKSIAIPNSVNVENILRKASTCPEVTHSSIVCVANHNNRKGVDVLIDAFAVASRDIDNDLVLIGDGPAHTAFRERVRELGIGARVQ